jgi:hypothetical protein
MGLLDKLTNAGSTLTSHNGNTPPTNPLATQQSQLLNGYSLNGAQSNTVSTQYNAYEDGITNPLPLPSQLDLDGGIPTSTPGGQGLPYLNNLPQ